MVAISIAHLATTIGTSVDTFPPASILHDVSIVMNPPVVSYMVSS